MHLSEKASRFSPAIYLSQLPSTMLFEHFRPLYLLSGLGGTDLVENCYVVREQGERLYQVVFVISLQCWCNLMAQKTQMPETEFLCN